MNRYNTTDSRLGPTGMTDYQIEGADFLTRNLGAGRTNWMPSAYGDFQEFSKHGRQQLNDQYGAANHVPGLYWDQYNKTGPNVVSGDVGATRYGDITAGTGAGYMGAYQTPLNTDFVDASLADYDAGVGKGYNAFRAKSASAFGNKRTGVAEANFMDEAARGRGALSSGLRMDAFKTAAGLGQTDAERALTASSTNAGFANDLSKFNANLQDQRERFNATQRDTSNARLLEILSGVQGATTTAANISKMGTDLGTAGVNNAATATTGNLAVNQDMRANANDIGNYGGMGIDQLLSLLRTGSAGIGEESQSQSQSKTDSSGRSTTNSSSRGTETKGTNWLEIAATLATMCWVAREVYGINPKWLRFREWLLTKAPKWLCALYLKRGKQFARYISDKPLVKSFIRGLMDRAIGATT